MKYRTKFPRIFATIFTIGFGFATYAQTAYTLTEQGLTLKVTGTSTLHDWEMTSGKAKGEAKATVEGQKVTFQTLDFSMVANTLKSGKNGMDDNAYKALKTKQHPNITFKITSAEQKGAKDLVVNGQLTIAGVTRNVSLTGTYKITANQITFEGKTNFKLTDFKIDPPTALLGTVKTGDDVGVEVLITYIKK
jgi:polyisoprenoid-binding protein YceI